MSQYAEAAESTSNLEEAPPVVAKYISKFDGFAKAITHGQPFFEVEQPDSSDEEEDRSRFAVLPINSGISIVCTADLHGNAHMAYIELLGGRKTTVGNAVAGEPQRISLADQGSLPADTDILCIAGDIGASCSEELSQGTADFDQTTSAHEDPKATDKRTLGRWRDMLSALLREHPAMHICCVAGNHDGLCCSDPRCRTCVNTSCRNSRHRWPLGMRPPGSSPSSGEQGLPHELERLFASARDPRDP